MCKYWCDDGSLVPKYFVSHVLIGYTYVVFAWINYYIINFQNHTLADVFSVAWYLET